MKTLIILMLLSFSAMAEVEVKFSDMDYRWWDVADYPVKAVQVGYRHWSGDTGIGITYGGSNEAKNILDTAYRDLTGEIRHLWVLGLYQKMDITDKYRLSAGVHYSEYKEVNGDSINSDTGWGYAVGVGYSINKDFRLRWSYDDYYHKHKEGYGTEYTRSNSLSIIYNGV